MNVNEELFTFLKRLISSLKYFCLLLGGLPQPISFIISLCCYSHVIKHSFQCVMQGESKDAVLNLPCLKHLKRDHNFVSFFFLYSECFFLKNGRQMDLRHNHSDNHSPHQNLYDGTFVSNSYGTLKHVLRPAQVTWVRESCPHKVKASSQE